MTETPLKPIPRTGNPKALSKVFSLLSAGAHPESSGATVEYADAELGSQLRLPAEGNVDLRILESQRHLEFGHLENEQRGEPLNPGSPIQRWGREKLTLENRMTTEIFYDIIRAIHMLRKAGERNTLYAIGHRASVPNNRLKNRLAELETLGLVSHERIVTTSGYAYCDDYARQVGPFLHKYGLGPSY